MVKKRVAKKASSENGVALKEMGPPGLMLLEALRTLDSSSRQSFASRLGMSFGDKRDLYESLGYKKDLDFDDFMAAYRRQALAFAAIEAPIRECWRQAPLIKENAGKDTAFEKAARELTKRLNVWSYLQRLDRLASLGRFAVMVMGTDDKSPVDKPLAGKTNLVYMMPFSEASVKIVGWVKDVKDPRYGKPEFYAITPKQVEGGSTSDFKRVHWTRVLHATSMNLESDHYGVPDLEPVFNDLFNLQLVAGGSGEMFWRGAFPGLAVLARKGVDVLPQDAEKLGEQVDDYIHGLKRVMRLKGMDVEHLAPAVADPKGHVEVYVDLVSAGRRIPKRILMGSERGELSSQQDEGMWNDTIETRQTDHCEPKCVRAFFDWCILNGAIITPRDGYVVEWPDRNAQGAEGLATTAVKKAEALSKFSDSSAAAGIPLSWFMKWGFELSEEQMQDLEIVSKAFAKEANGNDEVVDDGLSGEDDDLIDEADIEEDEDA